MQKDKNLHHIVIVGGGAGGLELATRLGNKLGKTSTAHITLVDQHLTHLWKPLWHEVAAGTLNSYEDELDYMAQAYEHGFNFELGRFEKLDRQKKEITLAPVVDEQQQEIIPQRTISYDTLVIAVGSISHDFATPGAKENCYFLDSRQQAENFHRHFLKSFMHAQNQPEPLKPAQLTIAVVGGGATGVELIAELYYATRQAVRYGWRRINPYQHVKLVLIESAERVLAALPKRLAIATIKRLKKMGVVLYTSQRVAKVTAEGVYTEGGDFIAADLKVWAAGIKAPDFLSELNDLEVSERNQLLVKQNLQTSLDEHIFAFGDCASCPQPNSDKSVPPRAQAAHQQAKLLANSISRKLAGKALLPYIYHDYGSLISLSRYNTVGELMGGKLGKIMLEGVFARIAYLSLYKTHQITLHGIWRVMLLTLANLLTRRIKPRLKLH